MAGRERGIRLYAVHAPADRVQDAKTRRSRLDALVDVVVRKYAPLPAVGLAVLVRRLRYAVPQWSGELSTALGRARRRLSSARVDGVEWYWPAGESPLLEEPAAAVRLLAPFDPVVWDRRRFELLWGWPYRFEAYTPVAQRQYGYYALPLLWRDNVIGWANLSTERGRLTPLFGYVSGGPPSSREFRLALSEELHRLSRFLRLHD